MSVGEVWGRMGEWGKRIFAVGKRLWEAVRRTPPRRLLALAAALLLWLGAGGMRGSVCPKAAVDQGGFGEVHWYENE